MTPAEIESIEDKCKQLVEYLKSDDAHEDGMDKYEHRVFEAALVAVCGPRVWDLYDVFG